MLKILLKNLAQKYAIKANENFFASVQPVKINYLNSF